MSHHHNHHHDDISLYSLKQDIRSYHREFFRSDAMAALTVALLAVPQAIAYAVLAGLPLTCGLFAAIYASMVAALFGSSRHLIVGPSNAIAILVQAGTSEILFNFYREVSGPEREALAVQILMQMVLLTGILQLLAAACKLGRLTQFVSHSVIIGYVAGSAVAVFVNQTYTFLGIDRAAGVHNLYYDIIYLITHFHYLHWPSTLIGVITLGSLVLFGRLDRRIPAAILALGLASFLAYAVDLTHFYLGGEAFQNESFHAVPLVQDTGSFETIFPSLAWPSLEPKVLNALLPFAFATALLSVMETTSVSKSIAANSGQRLSVNQEIFGVGLGNFISAFIVAMPISGSASRSSLNYAQGAKTRFAAVLNGAFVGLFLLLFSDLVLRIPLTALAALLLFTVINIVNFQQLTVCIKATGSDSFVLWTTFFSCIFLSLDLAFYIGIIISIILYLKKAALPQFVEYDVDQTSGTLKSPCYRHEHRNIRVIKVEGELFFGAADLFQNTLKTLTEGDTHTKVIILQMKNARDMDATSCLALLQLHNFLIQSNRYLIACGITQPIWDVLSDSGLVKILGKENLFIFDEKHSHQHYMQKALQRANYLASLPSQEDLLEPALEDQPAWSNAINQELTAKPKLESS